ncbi:hypothetical protein [Pseudoduganella violacea]|uniref:Uncharacterized protein n=1 Tax=Pseudoduganella violacea TaxID=1715466 RepID=A0A7W5BDC8_9BURK|nr:hypothetical protein [Pseudoduganella violacea]MBB3121081.1 hypothetical protein [Pseudoduganella violacea]
MLATYEMHGNMQMASLSITQEFAGAENNTIVLFPLQDYNNERKKQRRSSTISADMHGFSGISSE